MKLKDGDVFLTDKGLFVVKDGIPVLDEGVPGPFGGKIVRAALCKDHAGQEVVIVGRIHDHQPRNAMVKVRVIKDRHGTPGENEQSIMLDANTVVVIGAKKNG